MAISHVQPLLLLLASLFFLPVLCAIKFQYCNDIGYDFANITGVSFSPNGDDTKIVIFGNASRSLIAGDVGVCFFIGASESLGGCLYSLDKVANVLPIEPDTSFVLTLKEVPFNEELLYTPKKQRLV
ncbi:unnamed protein product [Arabis nemorensis]|uniref:Uncharacterized protein n=1 Tax=Arabis nemorensis TaxID=586526 RepID=A0A565ATK3_9BRAS|nr:unnamed protein product [Arabis nemorensis]